MAPGSGKIWKNSITIPKNQNLSTSQKKYRSRSCEESYFTNISHSPARKIIFKNNSLEKIKPLELDKSVQVN